MNRHAAQMNSAMPDLPRLVGRHCLTALYAISIGVTGCVHGTAGVEVRSAEQMRFLLDTLGSDSSTRCTTVASNWEVPVPVRQATLLWDNAEPVLVYEGVFREAVKTVWQPLEPGTLAFKGDGLVLGNRGTPFVRDFEKQKDALGNTWTAYRQKLPSGESYTAVIEFLADESRTKLVRMQLPTSNTESVQDVWLMPMAQKGRANVVVRVNSTSLNNEDGISRSRYVWFAVNADSGQTRNLGHYTEVNTNFSSVEFVPTGKEGEPVAIAIASPSAHSRAAADQRSISRFRMTALRMFSRKSGNEETVLYESAAPLASLVAKPLSATGKRLHLAWFEEATDSSNPKLQWMQVSFDPALPRGLAAAFQVPPAGGMQQKAIPQNPKAAQNKNTKPKKLRAKSATAKIPVAAPPAGIAQTLVRTRALPHIASHLEFVAFQKSQDEAPLLTWWANSESDFGINVMQTDNGNVTGVYAPNPNGRVIGAGQMRQAPDTHFMVILKRDPGGDLNRASSSLELCQFKASL